MPASPAPFCEIALGDITVTFIPDGYIYSDGVRSFPGSSEELWAKNPHLLDENGLVVMSIGSLLVRSSGHLALVDLAWGPKTLIFGGPDAPPSSPRLGGGDLVKNLSRVGVLPADIDAVMFSHLHADHTGWIVDPESDDADSPQDRLTFPRATHYVSAAEWTYWQELEPGASGPRPAPEELEVLATRLTPIAEGDHPIPGVDVMPTPGHTPGHLSFVISTGRDRAIVLGDAVHCPIEMQEPELSFAADVDPEMAKRTRRAIARELSEPGSIAAGPHFADLVFGRLITGETESSWSFSKSQVRAIA